MGQCTAMWAMALSFWPGYDHKIMLAGQHFSWLLEHVRCSLHGLAVMESPGQQLSACGCSLRGFQAACCT